MESFRQQLIVIMSMPDVYILEARQEVRLSGNPSGLVMLVNSGVLVARSVMTTLVAVSPIWVWSVHLSKSYRLGQPNLAFLCLRFMLGWVQSDW